MTARKIIRFGNKIASVKLSHVEYVSSVCEFIIEISEYTRNDQYDTFKSLSKFTQQLSS
jgi:hypothetical protein